MDRYQSAASLEKFVHQIELLFSDGFELDIKHDDIHLSPLLF
ncbi:MAG: hypothetical protein M2R45_03349 [Verrucomicrobia subdivision 3 bacterium]|nr:hypothetical protein [Limisphaerales bacterium]MCS1416737.1 hypothetical protein [Limisphaerales bacterium]